MRVAIRITTQLFDFLGTRSRERIVDEIDATISRMPELKDRTFEIVWELFIPARRADPLSIECIIPVSASPVGGQFPLESLTDLKTGLQLLLDASLVTLVRAGILPKPANPDAYAVSIFTNQEGEYYRVKHY